MAHNNTVTMRGVRIIFRNFSGKEGQYNKAGDRNFAVVIGDEDTAGKMAADGWNIKKIDPKEGYEEEGITFYLPVAIRFDVFPPRVMMVTSKGMTPMDESQIEMLDWADITNVDMIVRPHNWEMPGGKTGVKAYVKTMYVTIEEDELEAEYGIGHAPPSD